MSADIYLQRYAYPKTWINSSPKSDLGMVLAIPAYKEVTVIPTFESLKKCKLPECSVEVILVINSPADADENTRDINQKCYKEAREWASKNSSNSLRFHVILAEELPPKNHGVGLGRKIGMDEALRRFDKAGNVEQGIISCFDADSTCDTNYLTDIYKHFRNNINCPGVSIYYEHPIDKITDPVLGPGITQYELHLRYYIHAQRFAGLPYAYHTVGSSMAVKADAYQKQGGMNKRKAGEDFYFLHKIISLGSFTDLKSTTVYPSPRLSDRVPFGTGRAMTEWKENGSSEYLTYNPDSFEAIRPLFTNLKKIYLEGTEQIDLHECIKEFLHHELFEENLNSAKAKTRDFRSFKKRFYSWFNAFKLMKFLHFARDNYYENIPVIEASKWLLKEFYSIQDVPSEPEQILKMYRRIDRGRGIL